MGQRGRVHNGVIVTDQPLQLQEGTEVEIEPVDPGTYRRHPDTDRFEGIISPQVTIEDYHKFLEKKHS